MIDYARKFPATRNNQVPTDLWAFFIVVKPVQKKACLINNLNDGSWAAEKSRKKHHVSDLKNEEAGNS